MDGRSSDSIHVLHVDDEPDFADIAGTFLEREDDRFDVEIATGPGEALDRLEGRRFDCVVSDYDMPRRTGVEFLDAVREDYPNIPFILFTGKGSEEVASEAISAGVTDYLQKGSGTDQYTVLANRVRNAVERYRAEKTRERQHEAIETAREGISILDENGRYIYVNEAFAELHGYDPEEMIGHHWERAYFEEDVPEVREEILPEVERAGYWHGETTSQRADGTAVEVDHTLAMTDRDELVCTVRDISDQKERQKQLRQSSARLEALFERSPDMINIHDMDGNIIDPNPQLCEQTGYDADTLTDMKVWELDQAIDPNEAQDLWEQMEVGDRHRLEGTYRRRDGSTFPVEVHIRRLRLKGEDQVMAISRDISDRKQRQEILRDERDRLEEFASVISHDLRNPLNVAEGRIGLAQEECESEHLDDVESTLERSQALIDDLLTLAREGNRVDDIEAVDLGTLTEKCWRNVATGEATVSVDIDRTIHADQSRLQQLLENLYRNAVEHGGDEVTVTAGPLPDGFYIEDDGPEIPADERDKVLEARYSTTEDGPGFGLSIVKEIADAHGWDIRVTEGSDGGARFEVAGVEFNPE